MGFIVSKKQGTLGSEGPTLAQLNKRIRDKNYRFRKMPRNRQRVAIARDVLKLLDDQKLVARRGTYLSIAPASGGKRAATGLIQALDAAHATEQSFCQFVTSPVVECRVCAIGSVFTAAVMERGIDGTERAAERDPGDYRARFRGVSRQRMVKELSPYFTAKEMDDLERYFETESELHDLDDDEALRNAMCHIIRTDGDEVCP
jgi:hypothetical protein